ncbi:MAG: hypothetical protein NTY38_11115, partial [Acidobacteria bacterium]|nr:hypothetical protein [Acidobacteriota bacterium]
NACPDDAVTIESLTQELDEAKGTISQLMFFLDEALDAAPCEHCGHIHKREHMLAPFGLDALRKSSRWFCGFCLDRAKWIGGNQPEVRERIGTWFAVGYGREWMKAQAGPVAEFLSAEFAVEIMAARRKNAR